jgi:hypothetical protein
MAGALFIGLAASLAGCGGSGSKTSTTPAASSAASTKVAATTTSGTTPAATKAAASPAAAATSASSSGGGDCKYLSDADASALHANAGAGKVKSTDSPAAKQTACSWGTATDGVVVLVNEVKISAAISAMKDELNSPDVEKIDGLGDLGGFETKSASAVSVAFVKGNTQVLLTVSATSVDADAVAAAAKKIAGGL